MSAVTTMPRGRAFTRADLDALPDDGWRHELIDGSLLMTPSPGRWHQSTAFRLAVLLDSACPGHLTVMVAPFDVALPGETVLIPDVLVARRSDLTDRDLAAAPVLAVEVLSPSTRHIDLGAKLRRYETAGTASYWVVDPGTDTAPPWITMWQLVDGAYAETAHAEGEQTAVADLPWLLTVVPRQLRD